jgi:hypothetical protein
LQKQLLQRGTKLYNFNVFRVLHGRPLNTPNLDIG